MLHITVHERRLVTALRAAGRLGDTLTSKMIEAAAGLVLADFVARWIGKK